MLLQCTFLEVEQPAHTHGVILSKAAWSWGAEMGANDQGLSGGSAAVWTTFCHPGDHEERLLGTDLVRSDTGQALPQLLDRIWDGTGWSRGVCVCVCWEGEGEEEGS